MIVTFDEYCVPSRLFSSTHTRFMFYYRYYLSHLLVVNSLKRYRAPLYGSPTRFVVQRERESSKTPATHRVLYAVTVLWEDIYDYFVLCTYCYLWTTSTPKARLTTTTRKKTHHHRHQSCKMSEEPFETKSGGDGDGVPVEYAKATIKSQPDWRRTGLLLFVYLFAC